MIDDEHIIETIFDMIPDRIDQFEIPNGWVAPDDKHVARYDPSDDPLRNNIDSGTTPQTRFMTECKRQHERRMDETLFVDVVCGLLHRGRPTVYKYIRGDIYMTFDDVVTLAKYFEINKSITSWDN